MPWKTFVCIYTVYGIGSEENICLFFYIINPEWTWKWLSMLQKGLNRIPVKIGQQECKHWIIVNDIRLTVFKYFMLLFFLITCDTLVKFLGTKLPAGRIYQTSITVF